MSTIRGPSRGPGHRLPDRTHIKQCGNVASHFMRFFRHIEHAFVLGGILGDVGCWENRVVVCDETTIVIEAPQQTLG